MTRNILSIAVLGVFFGLGGTAFSAEPTGNGQTGQISAEMLAQLGLGSSSLVTDKEGETIRGKAKQKRTKKFILDYAAILKKTDGKKKKRGMRVRITRKTNLTLKRLKPGSYSLKYRVQVRGKNRIVKKTNYSPDVKFNL